MFEYYFPSKRSNFFKKDGRAPVLFSFKSFYDFIRSR